MITEIIVSTMFLIFLGLSIIKGRYAKAGIGEIPMIYESMFVQFILSISVLVFLGLSVFLLLFYSWKLFILLLAVGFIFENFIIIPIIERIMYLMIKIILHEK